MSTPENQRMMRVVRITLFLLFVCALVCLPFIIWGEEFVLPLLKAREHQAGWLVVVSVVLLAADSVAPVPATLVIMYLAAKAGVVAGILGGTLGMTAGVVAAAWFGRVAVGRLAPRFFPDQELERLRVSLQRQLALTLACLRSVPVLAETSVIVAAAAGIPLRRIVVATLLPNFAVCTIYSLAADDSFLTASLAFLGTLAASFVLWRWLRVRSTPGS
ncbi:MAG: VTT domain-containing protein [Opitutaceae bacterium]|nr:VTT domain-containing protein [Opitutaceae bacterium]